MAHKKTTALKTAQALPEPTGTILPETRFPIVGIGASAGGLAAFEAFFSGMPADKDPNMAFVLVQHLAPDHKSILTDLIRRYTRMQVFEATDGVTVQPNCTYIIPPAEMAAQVISFAAHAFGILHHPADMHDPVAENALNKIFILLRNKTGHDFSQYKPTTINLRIERRMSLYQIETKDGYVKYLQQTPNEVEALFSDLLIGVTNFFRDPEVFQVLESKVIPGLFTGRSAGSVIRVWVPGCSTGEEAYSIAILLQEHMESLKQNYTVQFFATDIDSKAIATARVGLYPASIAVDISPERLAHFFTPDAGGSTYRINEGLRKMLVFSEQDVIKDPPFSKIDLISCRNLLIYMSAELQKKLIPLFHYALNPGGTLFLGTSETVSNFGDLFETVDRKAKLYRRKVDIHCVPRVALIRPVPQVVTTGASLPLLSARTTAVVKAPLRELTEQALLHQVTPAAALVNGKGDILYLHGHTGMYLEPATGVTGIYNVLRMAREGLQHKLTIALHKAVAGKEIVRASGLRVKANGLRVKANGHFITVNLNIHPVATESAGQSETPLYLVVLEEMPSSELVNNPLPADTDAHIASLEQELRDKEESLLLANEELETSNEELKSSNEEMQSMNEELQSTNEELVTSQEELQSVNEELFTVNAELQSMVTDLSRAKNDMNNLLAGTDVGTIFVDFQLRIVHFTPAATKIINLVKSDVGRSVDYFTSNLIDYHNLKADINSVLDTLKPKEINVQTTEGEWYLMRIMPYRTTNNAVEGAVITFIDISGIQKAQKDLLRLTAIVQDANDAILLLDMDGRILAWNPAAERMYGWNESEAVQMNISDMVPEEKRDKDLQRLHELVRNNQMEPYRTQRLTKDGSKVEVLMTATALLDGAGEAYAIATTARSAA